MWASAVFGSGVPVCKFSRVSDRGGERSWPPRTRTPPPRPSGSIPARLIGVRSGAHVRDSSAAISRCTPRLACNRALGLSARPFATRISGPSGGCGCGPPHVTRWDVHVFLWAGGMPRSQTFPVCCCKCLVVVVFVHAEVTETNCTAGHGSKPSSPFFSFFLSMPSTVPRRSSTATHSHSTCTTP